MFGGRGEQLVAESDVQLFPEERLAELGRFVLQLEVGQVEAGAELVGAASLVVHAFLAPRSSHGDRNSSADSAGAKGGKGK